MTRILFTTHSKDPVEEEIAQASPTIIIEF